MSVLGPLSALISVLDPGLWDDVILFSVGLPFAIKLLRYRPDTLWWLCLPRRQSPPIVGLLGKHNDRSHLTN